MNAASRIFLFVSLVSVSVHGQLPTASHRLERFFDSFDRDPARTMDLLPPKYDSHGRLLKGSSQFSPDETADRSYVLIKEQVRQDHFSGRKILAEINPSNDYLSFLEKSKLDSIDQLAVASLDSGSSENIPWSGEYWATYRGGVAARYAAADFPESGSWKDYEKFFQDITRTDYLDPQIIPDLSPAEKYDLLIGDKNMGLTNWSIQTSKFSVDGKGEIETWFGLCHGWAPAAFMMARPEHAIEVPSADGVAIKFYPDDIKALSSLLWANSRFKNHFVGGRCSEKNPTKDPQGRILRGECWDVNPATFHLIVLNHLGVDRKSLVMDANFDYEVWNQPLVKYQVHYFNPQDRKATDSIVAAKIPLQNFSADKFGKYRSSQAKFVVGVIMDLTYTVEKRASHTEVNSPSDDFQRTVQYIYDLEIDNSGKIIGGEWYQNAHPDFLWAPADGAVAQIPSETLISTEWDGNGPVPEDLRQLGLRTAKKGFLVNKILQGLNKKASSTPLKVN
ncbi:MAG: hypothetical protein COT73_06985 [Bdellovibrio sp. CG10_big_fil_rev_8_21_14_0_10_47_8]|nr:MAG: hypothetical protein COT73_06985 [Bdellovibrio sp. CG10_big_fil_rev_8_21_14_0_10_47_8]